MAALAALYSVGPVAELLSQLDQEQQLHAALLADMWQMLIVSDVAVQLLAAAAGGEKGLSDAAISLLLSQDTFPHCILPLIKPVSAACLARGSKDQKKQLKQMMLSILGDLEEVWVDESLKDTLMGLPLPAMELLLSCDELKVVSEDTVLYTAQAYVNAVPAATKKQAQDLLAPLRCPQLSPFWLSASFLSDNASKLLLTELWMHAH